MAEAQVTTTIECGFCLRRNEALPQPKTLPCTHVHCLECLTGYFNENNLVLCPVQNCGEVFDGSPDVLPSYDMGGDDIWCDVCFKKKQAKQEAVIYCTYCCKKFCRKHEECHDEMLDEHPKKSIQEYRTDAAKLQIQTCTKHEDQPLVLGCSTCLTIACVKGVSELNKCDNDTSHSLLSLDDLVAALIQDGISAEMLAKEDEYEKLFKDTSKARADYDKKTKEMIQLIHDTRDTQANALKLKYQKLEEEVLEKRQKSEVDVAEFMEDMVLKKWTQLRNRRQLIESRVKRSHQVDVVKGFKQLKEEIQISVKEEIPMLQLRDELELRKLDENRGIEIEVVSSTDIVIDNKQGQTTLQALPQSLTLQKTIQLPALPVSVHHHNESTYVGFWNNNTVSRIDNNYQLYNSFITSSGYVDSITVYKDRLYTLSYGTPSVVNAYDMSGGHITSWNHPTHTGACDMLTVVADQVVIADPRSKRITIYSLSGESLRHIPWPLSDNNRTVMCAVDNTSVVISSYNTSKVFRVNITTGEVMWTLSDVNKPQGLVRYGSYILLVAHNNSTIYILDTSTGNIVSEIADSAIAGGYVFSLGVYGTTLVVPKYNNKQVLFYLLNNK